MQIISKAGRNPLENVLRNCLIVFRAYCKHFSVKLLFRNEQSSTEIAQNTSLNIAYIRAVIIHKKDMINKMYLLYSIVSIIRFKFIRHSRLQKNASITHDFL